MGKDLEPEKNWADICVKIEEQIIKIRQFWGLRQKITGKLKSC